MTLWLIPRSGNPKRLRLIDRSFHPRFYVRGPERLQRRLARELARRARAACRLTEKTDIWDGPVRVLEVTVHHSLQFAPLVRFVQRVGEAFRLYNSDLMLASLYCWEKNVFPLAKVEVQAGGRSIPDSEIRALECRDDEWAVDYELPPLATMQLRLEGFSRVDPQHGRSRQAGLEVECDGKLEILDDAEEPVAAGFERLLRASDPDLLVTEWGDATLLPALERQAQLRGFSLSLNRPGELNHSAPERSRARSYTSYGRVLFKGSATTLFGRLHVDIRNSFIAHQCELDGLWELARTTKLPVQYCARTTTGTGISYMQMELAWRDGTLIPAQKAEPESPKHPDELLAADRGGLVFPPRLGFFENAAELDFVSEFPSIMARFNISPETVNCRCCPDAPRVPELGYRICQKRRGITSRVVERLIAKRQQFKEKLKAGNREPRGRTGESEITNYELQITNPEPPIPNSTFHISDPESRIPSPELSSLNAGNYSLRRAALKWLLVCCFGYTGYKNARFGKIEAHEAINAVAREKLLVAKGAAEERGYRVLHALVDSLYVERAGATHEDYEELAREIERLTGLPLALEAVYRYVVFLPSKQNAEIPVPNRFFAVTQDGELKIRGLECRRHDAPPIVVKMQHEALEILAEARNFEGYCRKIEEARSVLARYLARIENGSAAIEQLVISRRISRAPADYKQASATAVASQQLERSGVHLRPGETIEYVITDADSKLSGDRVRAFALWEGWRGYDVAAYRAALLDAFKPFEQFATPVSGRATIAGEAGSASITASAMSSDTSPLRAGSGVKGERSEFIADP
jgi:DNA polymerase elongation subunit (family B)